MNVLIKRDGDELVMPLSLEVVEALGLKEGSTVQVSLENGVVTVKPLVIKRRTLPKSISGMGKTLGDIVSPIVDEEDFRSRDFW
jgi:antitoxin component of MazEF toxin-antitoxin module